MMNGTTNSISTTTTAKPPSSVEAREGLEKTRAEISAALASGNMESYVAAQLREKWFTESLRLAEQREEEARLAAEQAERDSHRPAAEEAAHAARPEVVFAPFYTALDESITNILKAADRWPELMEAQRAANERAEPLCRLAGMGFSPGPVMKLHDYVVEQRIVAFFRSVVVRELTKRGVMSGAGFLPSINFVR